MAKRKLPKPNNDEEDNTDDPAPLPTSEDDVPEGLELWDYYCPVRTPVRDKKFAFVDKELVSETFECPICLDVVKGTMVVTECMHRFCQECIEKTMRLGKKQCPTCRSQVPSRRALRSDKTFDEIAEILFLKGDFENETNTDGINDNNDSNNTNMSSENGSNNINDVDSEFTNAMDYRRRKTAKWDTLEEREQEKLDEETRKIVEKYQTSDFAKMVIRGMRKQRAIVEAQDKEHGEVPPEDSSEAGDSTPGSNDDVSVTPPPTRGRRGRKRGRKSVSELVESHLDMASPGGSEQRGGRGPGRRKESAKGGDTSTGESAKPTFNRGAAKSLACGINVVVEPLVVDPEKDPLCIQLPALERKYLMISGDATIGIVGKYLAGKFGESCSHVVMAMECDFDVPVITSVPNPESAQGYKVLSPGFSLSELNGLRKRHDLLSSSTLFLKYFKYDQQQQQQQQQQQELNLFNNILNNN